MTDPISDMLTRIRNAQAVKKTTVIIPFSKLKWAILEVLKKQGFIKDIEKVGRSNKKIIEVNLKYRKDGSPRISILKRISKSSRRAYVNAKKIWFFKHGFGISVITTSKGIMTDKEARKEKLGGEVLLEIY
ncbi:MAG: 30S ribosomal protein S8 [Candidatus Paceibacterota bacterium]|jgi:small subunit ribosomal protein S8